MNQQISSFFIRPPRQSYYDHDLGPQMFPLCQKNTFPTKMVTRTDFYVLNNRNLKINASFYQLQNSNSQKCLIYLHTHHGSRLQATFLIQPMLYHNINLCIFDFSGYGNSQGDTVTLGIKQSEDIHFIVQNLKKKYEQQYFILWGRSMGAVASLIYLSKLQKQETSSIIGGIFDSPFHSLHQLTLQLGSKSIGIPQPFLRPFIYIIKKSLQNSLNFEQLELQPIVSLVKASGLFITSKQDKFVSHTHSQKLYNKYGGPKQLIYIDKDHNQPRKQEDLAQVFSFIRKKMSMTQKIQKFNCYIGLISKHLKFIDDYQNQNLGIQYFSRDTNKELQNQQPLTQRLEYNRFFKKPNYEQLTKEISSNNKMIRTSRQNKFNKTQTYSKLKYQIK